MDNGEFTCRIGLTWAPRKKRWDIHVSGGNGKQTWTWSFEADTRVAVDQGTAYLLGAAVRDALESQLV